MKWYTPKPGPTLPTVPTVTTSKLASLPLPHHYPISEVSSKPTSLDVTVRRVVVEKQTSIDDQVRENLLYIYFHNILCHGYNDYYDCSFLMQIHPLWQSSILKNCIWWKTVMKRKKKVDHGGGSFEYWGVDVTSVIYLTANSYSFIYYWYHNNIWAHWYRTYIYNDILCSFSYFLAVLIFSAGIVCQQFGNDPYLLFHILCFSNAKE